jgi:elongation factor Ts
MAEITATLVKTLRERTGAGMMDCKKALISTHGDIELAVDAMRKAGQANAAKRAGRSATEGTLVLKMNQSQSAGWLLEINCETDFVAKEAAFLAFCQQAADRAMAEQITDLNALRAICESNRVALVAQLGENVQIRRLATLQGERVGGYLHGQRIGVLVAATSAADAELIKQIAMHIAASKPEYIHPHEVPTEVIAREREVQLAIALQSGKSPEIAEKMVVGRLLKFTSELALTEQPFLMDNTQRVGERLQAFGATVTDFTRFELGEGLEKASIDFAAEVTAAAQLQ